MKNTTKFIACAFALIMGALNTACVEYTQPICDASNLVDTGIEGSKNMVFYADFEASYGQVEIKRVGKGIYQASENGNNPIYTCNTAKGLYAESKADSGNYVGYRLNLLSNKAFGLMDHFVARSDLDSGKVPYVIEKRKYDDGGLYSQYRNMVRAKLAVRDDDDTYEVLVIRNSRANNPYLINKGQAVGVATVLQ